MVRKDRADNHFQLFKGVCSSSQADTSSLKPVLPTTNSSIWIFSPFAFTSSLIPCPNRYTPSSMLL